MTDYGQLIPNKVVQLNDLTGISKSKFTHLLASAFVKVGMQFIGSWSSYDVLDPANEEFGTPGQGYTNRNFFFDFPTADTFLIDNLPYRPCMSIYAHITDAFSQAQYNGAWSNGFGIQLGRRRADRLFLSDFQNSYGYRIDPGNFGNGQASNTANPYKFGMSMRSKEGYVYEYNPPYWKTFAATSMTPGVQSTPRNFKNFYVYLGKAGLFVFVGTGSSGAEFGNLISAGIVFAGGRIPGRGRIPIQDVNLNRINPTIEMPMFTTHPDYLTGGVLNNPLLGIQHDLKSRPGYPAQTAIYNLENAEQPLYPSFEPSVLRSPRIVNGNGAYILTRPVIVPQYMMNDGTDYVGPIDPQITGTAVRPQWADVFTAQNFRFGDRTVTTPLEYIDPQTSKHWFLVHAENTNMAYALGYDGRVIYNDVNLTQTLYGIVNVDFSVGGFAGPFPAGITVSIVNTGPGANWTQVPGQNAVELLDNGQTYPNHGFIIEYIPQPGDPTDLLYILEWESEAPATTLTYPNSVTLDAYVWDVYGTANLTVREYLTTNPADPQYTYRLHTAAGQLIAGAGVIRFELVFYNPGYYNVANTKMRNFRITKYRYA